MAATATRPRIDDMIRHAISAGETLEPYEIARRIASDATADAIEEILVPVIAERTRRIMREYRREAQGRKSGTRWDGVAAALLEMPYVVLGERKRLGSCSRADVFQIVEDYRRRAAEHAAHAARMMALFELMQEANVVTVDELGEEAVAGVLAT